MEVLVVCSGNIVRSPLAEGLLRKILADIAVPVDLSKKLVWTFQISNADSRSFSRSR